MRDFRFLRIEILLLLFISSVAAGMGNDHGLSVESTEQRVEVHRHRDGCRVIDRFALPSLDNGLCVSRVERYALCDGDNEPRHSIELYATPPKKRRSCDNLVPSRDFVDMSIIRMWEDAPALLNAASQHLSRLPREFRRYALTTEEMVALNGAGLSSLYNIDFYLGHARSGEWVKLLFFVDECDCNIALLMNRKRLWRHDWAVVLD